MRTYVVQFKTPQGTQVEICQADNVTEALKFLADKVMYGHIEYIYSEQNEE